MIPASALCACATPGRLAPDHVAGGTIAPKVQSIAAPDEVYPTVWENPRSGDGTELLFFCNLNVVTEQYPVTDRTAALGVYENKTFSGQNSIFCTRTKSTPAVHESSPSRSRIGRARPGVLIEKATLKKSQFPLRLSLSNSALVGDGQQLAPAPKASL
jgi:hypothetical protein